MNNENSTIVIDQQALATGCVHWKRTVPYSNVVKRTTQNICTGYKESIGVLESRYFFDYLCHWNWFLFSPLVFNLFIYIFFSNSRRWVSLTGNSLRAVKVTLAGPKSDIGRAENSHKGQNVTLQCYNERHKALLSIVSRHAYEISALQTCYCY